MTVSWNHNNKPTRPLTIRVIESLLAWSPAFLIPTLLVWWFR